MIIELYRFPHPSNPSSWCSCTAPTTASQVQQEPVNESPNQTAMEPGSLYIWHRNGWITWMCCPFHKVGNQAWQQANKTAKPMTSLHVFPALHFAVTSNDLFSAVGRWFICYSFTLQADKKRITTVCLGGYTWRSCAGITQSSNSTTLFPWCCADGTKMSLFLRSVQMVHLDWWTKLPEVHSLVNISPSLRALDSHGPFCNPTVGCICNGGQEEDSTIWYVKCPTLHITVSTKWLILELQVPFQVCLSFHIDQEYRLIVHPAVRLQQQGVWSQSLGQSQTTSQTYMAPSLLCYETAPKRSRNICRKVDATAILHLPKSAAVQCRPNLTRNSMHLFLMK